MGSTESEQKEVDEETAKKVGDQTPSATIVNRLLSVPTSTTGLADQDAVLAEPGRGRQGPARAHRRRRARAAPQLWPDPEELPGLGLSALPFETACRCIVRFERFV